MTAEEFLKNWEEVEGPRTAEQIEAETKAMGDRIFHRSLRFEMAGEKSRRRITKRLGPMPDYAEILQRLIPALTAAMLVREDTDHVMNTHLTDTVQPVRDELETLLQMVEEGNIEAISHVWGRARFNISGVDMLLSQRLTLPKGLADAAWNASTDALLEERAAWLVVRDICQEADPTNRRTK